MKTDLKIKERLKMYEASYKEIDKVMHYSQARRLKLKINELRWVLDLAPMPEDRLLERA